MRCEKGSRVREKAVYAPALYVLLATFAVNLVLILLCCSYTVLGTGTWKDFSVVTRIFSLDKRSIALGRIILGCISLYDLVIFRMKYALCFYTDLGMWPRTLILRDADPQAKKNDFSPYMAVSSHTQIFVCFLIVAFCCFTTIVGYYTKISIFVLWVHTRGFAFRNSGIQQAGDTLHRLLLFWMMFLPCHECFSIDSARISSTIRAKAYARSQNVTSLATFGTLVQLDLIYQFTSMFKVSPRWSVDGSAIYYVLNNLAFVYPPVGRDILLKFVPPSLLSILTKSTLLLERCAPLFIFVYPLRNVGVIAFISFHFGLFCSMRLGLFPLICIAGWIILIPSYSWGNDSQIEIARDSGRSPLDENWYGGLNGASFFASCVIFGIGYCMVVLLQILAIYLALVSNINTLPKIAVKIPKLFDILNLDTYLATFANRYVFEMPPKIYEIARFLGQNQQWFLFDKPQEYSFWFDIVGLVEIKSDNSPPNSKEKAIKHVNLHKILQMYINDKYFLSQYFAKPSLQDRSTIWYQPITGRIESVYDDFDWEELFTNNRFRKLYQRLADSKNRYSEFHVPFALHVKYVYDLMKDASRLGNIGNLKELKFIANRIPTSPWEGNVDVSDNSSASKPLIVVSKEMWSYKFNGIGGTKKKL